MIYGLRISIESLLAEIQINPTSLGFLKCGKCESPVPYIHSSGNYKKGELGV